MILSLGLGRNLIFAALVDESNIQGIHTQKIELDYQANKFVPIITPGRISEIAEHLGYDKEVSSLKINILKLSRDVVVPQFKDLQIEISELESVRGFNFVPIVLDPAFIKENESLLKSNVGKYLNFAHYHVPFPVNDLHEIEEGILNSSLNYFTDSSHLYLSNLCNHLDESSLKKYFPRLFRNMLPLNPKVRSIHIKFDHSFLAATIMSGLTAYNIDTSLFLKMLADEKDVVVLNLISLKKFSLYKNDKDVTDKIQLEKINYYPLGREDAVRFESSVLKQEYNNILGVVLDTRQHVKH